MATDIFLANALLMSKVSIFFYSSWNFLNLQIKIKSYYNKNKELWKVVWGVAAPPPPTPIVSLKSSRSR